MSMTRGEFPHPDSVKLDELLGGKDASRIWHAQYTARPGLFEGYVKDKYLPSLRMEQQMELWYLAHPITGDGVYDESDNMEHALVVQGLLWEVGLKIV
ncbi:MAG: hypothetical protein QQN63_14010, partial [Nitrosopumilus sp.]